MPLLTWPPPRIVRLVPTSTVQVDSVRPSDPPIDPGQPVRYTLWLHRALRRPTCAATREPSRRQISSVRAGRDDCFCRLMARGLPSAKATTRNLRGVGSGGARKAETSRLDISADRVVTAWTIAHDQPHRGPGTTVAPGSCLPDYLGGRRLCRSLKTRRRPEPARLTSTLTPKLQVRAQRPRRGSEQAKSSRTQDGISRRHCRAAPTLRFPEESP